MSELGAEFGLSKIGQIPVPVTDIDRTVRFYRDTLGMRLLFLAPSGLVFFDLNGVRLMLDGSAKGQARNGSAIYYKVDDLEAAFETLSKRGVDFGKRPHVIATLAGSGPLDGVSARSGTESHRADV